MHKATVVATKRWAHSTHNNTTAVGGGRIEKFDDVCSFLNANTLIPLPILLLFSPLLRHYNITLQYNTLRIGISQAVFVSTPRLSRCRTSRLGLFGSQTNGWRLWYYDGSLLQPNHISAFFHVDRHAALQRVGRFYVYARLQHGTFIHYSSVTRMRLFVIDSLSRLVIDIVELYLVHIYKIYTR